MPGNRLRVFGRQRTGLPVAHADCATALRQGLNLDPRRNLVAPIAGADGAAQLEPKSPRLDHQFAQRRDRNRAWNFTAAGQLQPGQRLSRAEQLVSRITRQLESLGETEIPSSTVGDFIMKALKTVDEVAYVRYASVYKDFRHTGDFANFLGDEGLDNESGRS